MTTIRTHTHGGHTHSHRGETHLSGAGTSERAFGGPVVVDVGAGVGALVVHLDRDWLDDELQLRSVDRPEWSTHTGVWERHVGGSRQLVAAVFPSLPTGRYEILERDGHTVMRVVNVVEATVTEI